MSIIVLAAVAAYLGVTMYLANQEQIKNNQAAGVNAMLYLGVLFIMLLGLTIVMTGLAGAIPSEDLAATEAPIIQLSAGDVLIGVLISVVATFTAMMVITSEDTRRWFQQRLVREGAYSPQSIVHTTAIVLSLVLLTGQVVLFIASGGTEAMAEDIDTAGIPIGLPIFQAALQVAAAFLGVGFALRRELPETLQRLGLRLPTPADLRWGFGGGLLLFVIPLAYSMLIGVLIGFGLVSQEQIDAQNQAAESLAQAFTTIPSALVLAASAGIGEEIFFRGALQPIFGNVLTSAFFALMHTQALTSPSILILFLVSLSLGWIRRTHSTTAAIIAHFVYNFVQLLLITLTTSAGAV